MFSLFKDIVSTSKVKRVKCIFCNIEVVKNGTRMVKHIIDCKKCDDIVKRKYVTKDTSEDTEQVGDITDGQPSIKSHFSTSAESSLSIEVESVSSPSTFTASNTTNTLEIEPKKSSSGCQPKQSKINTFMDKMSDSQIISEGILININYIIRNKQCTTYLFCYLLAK